jgi:hypothetical protein
VTVNLETDRDGCIADAKLCLDRAFIEHAKEGALARDPGTTGSGSASSVPDRGDAASAPACMGHPGLIRLISQGETATIPPIEGQSIPDRGEGHEGCGIACLLGAFPNHFESLRAPARGGMDEARRTPPRAFVWSGEL